MKLRIQFTKQADFMHLKSDLWALYQLSNEVTYPYFENRIHQLETLALYFHGKKLIGFSAIMVDKWEIGKSKIMTLGLSFAAILPEYRYHNLIQLTMFKLVMSNIQNIFFYKMYFWCLASSYRPYLIFAKHLAEFYPSRREVTPVFCQEIMFQLKQKHCSYYKIEQYDGYVLTQTHDFSVKDQHIPEKYKIDPDFLFYEQLTKASQHKIPPSLSVMATVSFKNFFFWTSGYAKNVFKK